MSMPVSAPRERNILGCPELRRPLPFCQVDNYLVCQSWPICLTPVSSGSPARCASPSLLVADPVFPRDHALASTTNSRNCDVFSFATREPRPFVPHLIV
jgi:hypothetical protein